MWAVARWQDSLPSLSSRGRTRDDMNVQKKSIQRVAAIQLEAVLGDIARNLSQCERLAIEAGEAGADWIVLPEFFTTGMGFTPVLIGKALPPDGPATRLLLSLARRFHAHVGGSFLCLDDDGEVRNAFFLASPDGIIGRHNKDVPTLWENCWYVGGTDDGRFNMAGTKLGVVLCAEFGRTETVRRLRGVDLVLGGSFTWHMPDYFPKWAGRESLDRQLFREVSDWASPFARLVGAPVVEAAHCGTLRCRDQLLPLSYTCQIGDGTRICAADGTVLASRKPTEGPGVAVADVETGSTKPFDTLPSRAWLKPLGPIGQIMWSLQRWRGRAWYGKHISRRGRLD